MAFQCHVLHACRQTKMFFFVLCLSCTGSGAQVTLTLAKEPACSGEDLTFTCEGLKQSGLIVWRISDLPGVPNTSDAFGSSLSNIYNRIASPDSEAGSNPSIIMIQSVQAIDSGATVQCGVINMESSNVITLSIRNLLNCSAKLSVTDIGSFTISLSWTQHICSDVMPMHYLVEWAQKSTSRFEHSGIIPISISSYNITSVRANTVYEVFLVVMDVCGNMTAGRQTVQTLNVASPPTHPSPTAASPTTAPSFSDGCGGITAGVVVGCLFLSLLASVATGVITFFCTRSCYKKSSPPPNEKSVYYETVQSDSVQMQPSPAYESVEKKM